MDRRNRTILDAGDVQRVLSRMTDDILANHRGTDNLIVIGIHTRGAYIANRIQTCIEKQTGVKIPAGDMDITLYRDDWTRISQHPVIQATDILFSVDEKRIILVDDVLFTGRTTRAAMDAVIDFGRPERIELAVLVDRGHRELPIQANYVGKIVETRRNEHVNVLLAEHDGEDRVVLAHQLADTAGLEQP
jgi:pyrimidine operon attenuation protein/uracil phosphoribosyltransferase